MSVSVQARGSVCYGSPGKGRMTGGVRMPVFGKNFKVYSRMAVWAGRTHVHSQVRAIVVRSYKILAQKYPYKVFRYAETGFKKGGKFHPHKTHQNGLSVDFIVPVLNRADRSVYLPATALNRWSYAINFDLNGRYRGYKIDFLAMAAHIVTLDQVARNSGQGLRRVIFDPQMQRYLFATRYGNYLREHIRFSKRRSWVRHDEHYHIDFKVGCEKY